MSIKDAEAMITFRPAPGQETAQLVLDIVRIFSEHHDQNSWEGEGSCGTTRCVAGWVQIVQGQNVSPGNTTSFLRGRDGLRISIIDAIRLFHGTDDEEAVAALEYLAKGEEINWDEVYKNYDVEGKDEKEEWIINIYQTHWAWRDNEAP
jgi:hypothetical protein